MWIEEGRRKRSWSNGDAVKLARKHILSVSSVVRKTWLKAYCYLDTNYCKCVTR